MLLVYLQFFLSKKSLNYFSDLAKTHPCLVSRNRTVSKGKHVQIYFYWVVFLSFIVNLFSLSGITLPTLLLLSTSSQPVIFKVEQ